MNKADEKAEDAPKVPDAAPHTNVPAIVHLLHPDAPAMKWAEVHPAHMIKLWTREELDVCSRLVPEFATASATGVSRTPLLDALLVLYLFGGTAICHAREPKQNVLKLLLAYPSSVLLLTAPTDGSKLDTQRGLIAATARIRAFRALFALLARKAAAAADASKAVSESDIAAVVKEFFAASMQASKNDTIRVIATDTVGKMLFEEAGTIAAEAAAPPSKTASAAAIALPPLPATFLAFAAATFGPGTPDVDVQVVEAGDDDAGSTNAASNGAGASQTSPLIRAVANAILAQTNKSAAAKNGGKVQAPADSAASPTTFAILDDADFKATEPWKSAALLSDKFRTLLPTLKLNDYVCVFTRATECKLAAAAADEADPEVLDAYGIGGLVATQLRMLGAAKCLPPPRNAQKQEQQVIGDDSTMLAVWRITQSAADAISLSAKKPAQEGGTDDVVDPDAALKSAA